MKPGASRSAVSPGGASVTSLSAADSGHTCPKVTTPSFDRSAHDDGPRAGRYGGALDPGVGRPVGGHAVAGVDSAGAEDERVEAQPLERHLGQVAGDDQLARADVAARRDEAHVLVVGKVDQRPDPEWHHRHRPAPQRPSDLGGRGTRVKCHGLAIGDERGHGAADALLRVACLEGPHRIGLLVGPQAGRHRRAVRSADYAIAPEGVQVPANGHLRAAELGCQLADRYRTAPLHHHRERPPSRRGVHDASNPSRARTGSGPLWNPL